MNGVETRDGLRQGTSHGRRPIQAAQEAARKVGHLDAFEIDRLLQGYGAVLFAVDIRREDMDIVAESRESATEGVNRADRAAVSKRGQIRRGHVKEAQGLPEKERQDACAGPVLARACSHCRPIGSTNLASNK